MQSPITIREKIDRHGLLSRDASALKIAVSAGAGDLQLTVKYAFVSAVRPECP